MNEHTNPLNNLKIASPCSQDWNQMIGTERKRYCGECKLNVYNLSGMARAEAENLIVDSEGRLCVRFYKRADGTVLTKDCPVGWRALKRRVSRISTAVASLVFGVAGGLGLNQFFSAIEEPVVMGRIPVYKNPPVEIVPAMGEIEIVEPNYPIAGGISNIEEVRRQVRKKRR